MNASRIVWTGMPATYSIFAAPTPGAARYAFLLSLRDVYPGVTFAQIRVARAPAYDAAAQPKTRPTSFGWCDGRAAFGVCAGAGA